MTKKETEQSDPRLGGGESISEWVEEGQRNKHESRAQRRWRETQRAHQSEADQVEVEEGALVELGALVEEWGELEPQEESGSESTANQELIYFGQNDSATIRVRVSTQGDEAVVEYLSLDVNEPAPGIEDVVQVLEWNFGVVHGIDEDAINELLERSLDGGVVEERRVIARGTPVQAGEDGRISYPFMADAEAEEIIDGAAAYGGLQSEDIKAVFALEQYPRLVAPGTVLAEVAGPTHGKAGRSVRGEAIVKPGADQKNPGTGDNVVEENGIYRAEAYGYACMMSEELHVLSPIWIAPDQMSASFIQYPQGAPAPKPDSGWIMDLLEHAGVRHGIIEPAIEKLAQGIDQDRGSAPVLAKGSQPKHGEDAYFEPAYDSEVKPGKIKEDGSIDFRQRNVIIGVSEDDFLGEFVPAMKGQDGMNVRGEELEGHDGGGSDLVGGEGVRVEEENPTNEELGIRRRFYASCDGSVRQVGEKLEVLPITTINGNVDYEVGHIVTKGDVAVSGSVLYGFEIKCGGNLVIGGEVENGVKIQADGDIVVSQRIVGYESFVVAGGNIECKLVQNATVVAQGDITVGNYIMNAHVRAGNEILVHAAGGKRGGSIVGGETFATVALAAEFLGSPGMEPTLIGCRVPPHQQAHLQRLRGRSRSLRQQIDKGMAVMGVRELDRKRIEEAIVLVSAEERASFMKALKDAYQATDDLVELQQQIESIEEEHQQLIRGGQIRGARCVYPGVVVEFGDKTLPIDAERPATVYTFGDERIEEQCS